MRSVKLSVFLLYLSIFVVDGLQECNTATNCADCYAIPNCDWCADENNTIPITNRCFRSNDGFPECNNIQDAQSTVDVSSIELSEDIQISLTKARLKLRAGETQSFEVRVRPAENFPLDLYMVVDLSNSLADDLTTIQSIASDIADSLRNISTRFQVGFGTYVDKVTVPYVSEIQQVGNGYNVSGMLSACQTSNCTFPFSYVHNINLTNSSQTFTNGFDNIEISTNADPAEGTGDAMLQAVLCPEIVGWRENARKILVVVTDESMHTAGDGEVAGIVKQAPLECHTAYDPERNIITYVNNTLFDYPSIEIIRQVFENNLVTPVFAITEGVQSYFDLLVDALSGLNSQSVQIAENSSNIIEAIETAYENIVSEVSLNYGTDADFTITNTVTCPEGTNLDEDDMRCSNVSTNDTVIFDVSVTLNECSDGFQETDTRNVTVTIPGYGQFEIQIVALCTCDCEENPRRGDDICTGNGVLSCGVCECDDGWLGDICCIDASNPNCPSGANGVECSGRGDCVCNECECTSPDIEKDEMNGQTVYIVPTEDSQDNDIILVEPPRVYSEDIGACECDNFRCERNKTGFVCSGNQGNCTCSGECECGMIESEVGGPFPYFGDACSCNNAFCYADLEAIADSEPCNGNGDCQPCFRDTPCNCAIGFIEPFCVRPDASTQNCFSSGSSERNCVQCIAENSDFISNCGECNTMTYSRLSGEAPSDFNVSGSRLDTTVSCDFSTTDPICTYYYYIALSENASASNQIQLVAVEPLSGCFPLRWWHLALILLGSLIILGILILIIVKLIFIALDYVELKSFQKEVAETDLSKNFNPLYTSPEVKYDNIAFGKE